MSGTPVLTEDGLAAIEDVCAGDMVWAADPMSGEVALKTVVQTFVNETQELVHIQVNGEEIICTPEHPFYSPVLGWTEAIQLRAGDILVLVNGEYAVVEQVQHEILEAPIKVYNFEVEEFHTYYVGTDGVLVHNMCSIGIDSFDFTNFSTGRFIPENLYEKLALEAAKSNPLAGKVIVPVLNDPRLPVGMSKFSQVFSTSLGKIEIHYVGNATLNIFFDWKFKF